MKNLSLVLMMGLGFASFAQAEECIDTGISMMTTQDSECNVVDDKHFYSVSAICRNGIGSRVRYENRTCEAMHGMKMDYSTCGQYSKKIKGWGSKSAEVAFKSCHGAEKDGAVVQSIENSWKNKVCFIDEGKKDGCHGAGKQTKEGCVIDGKVETDFFYDSKCTVPAKSTHTQSEKTSVGDSSQQSDLKEKKLKPDTRPGGMMAKPASIPMESVKSNSAK